MRPAFDKDGTITAANASQLSDGGSALVLMSRTEAERRGVDPLGEFVSYGMVAGPDNASLLHQPSRAIRAAAERAGIAVDDIDLFEINEAFAAQSVVCMKMLEVPEDRFNVNGGAIALGHPIGASGTRILVTLIHALEQRDKTHGVACLCLGGGNAVAMCVRRV